MIFVVYFYRKEKKSLGIVAMCIQGLPPTRVGISLAYTLSL